MQSRKATGHGSLDVDGAPPARSGEQEQLRALKAQLRSLREMDAGVMHQAFEPVEDAGTAARIARTLGAAIRDPGSLRAWPGKLVRLMERRGVSGLPGGISKLGRALPGTRDIQTVTLDREDYAGVPDVVPLPGPRLVPASLAELRLALIADGFTADGLRSECHCIFLGPDDWAARLQEEPPHLLLVESAWQGRDGEWAGQVSGCSPSLRSLVASCRRAGIPTVFWNKEDPLHFEAFIGTARLFDHVCTTDAASIPRYRRELGHDRVHLLPFAYQPKLHHPIQRPGEVRSGGSVFAGAWYANLAERCRDFMALADGLALAGQFTILDRATIEPSPNRAYPQRYRQYLRDGVPYAQTPDVYRGHRIGLTLNTVKDSPTMFARRALELMGCNTSVYGNFNVALHRLFGDLTVSSDDGERILEAAFDELRNPDAGRHRQRRLQALRKVLLEYTWDARLSDLAELLWGRSHAHVVPVVNVVARADDQSQFDRLWKQLRASVGVDARLWVQAPVAVQVPSGAQRLDDGRLRLDATVAFGGSDALVAPWHPADAHGPYDLQDLCLARKFGQGAVVGRAGHGNEYRVVDRLLLRRSLFPAAYLEGTLADLLDGLDAAELKGAGLVAIDAGDEHSAWPQGAGLAEMRALARALPASPAFPRQPVDFLSGATLARMFAGIPGVSTAPKRHRLELVSRLPGGASQVLTGHAFGRGHVERNGRVVLCLDAPAHPAFELALEGLDAAGNCVDRQVLAAGSNVGFVSPPEVTAFRLVLHVRGPVVTHLDGLWLKERPSEPLLLPGDERVLLVTNAYPSAGDLYRNAFVHRRVLAYRRRGVEVDVVRMARPGEMPHGYEYQGVAVQVCTPDALRATLVHSGHRTIAVHFLDAAVWHALAPVVADARVVVWVHGSDLQPWSRRPAHYRTEAELAAAKQASEVRLAWWRSVLADPPQGLHLVFVSRTFAEQSWEDLGLRLPDDRWSVIPNPIDIDLFKYVPKPVEQRFHILSVRPHHSRIYANDLVAATIERLSEHPLFPKLRFTLVGDGPLWDENFTGLEGFPNVELVRRFMPQEEIAGLHRTHGVFLVPTRGDTQGVSRDEAMASGLVPVSCKVGAVAEFVPPGSGVLVAPESVEGLVEAVLVLAGDAEAFADASALAARTAGTRDVFDVRISNELGLLGRFRAIGVLPDT